MVLPRKGKWQLKLVRFPSNGSVRFVEVDFGASTGTLQQGGQSCALTAITQVSATRFTASYNTGRFQGSLDGEIRNDGSPDVKFRGNQSGDCTGIPVDLTDPRSAPANSGTTSLLMVEEGIDAALIGAQLSLSSDWVTSLPQMITRIHWRRAGKKVTHLFIFSHGVDAGGLHSIALDNTGHLNPATEFDANPKTMQQISEESKRTGVPMSKIAPSDGTKVPGTLLLQEVSEALGGVWVQAGDSNSATWFPACPATYTAAMRTCASTWARAGGACRIPRAGRPHRSSVSRLGVQAACKDGIPRAPAVGFPSSNAIVCDY